MSRVQGLCVAIALLTSCAGRSASTTESNSSAGVGVPQAADLGPAQPPWQAADQAAAITECIAGEGRAPWNPYDEVRTLRGNDGDMTDSCDGKGNLISHQCEHQEYRCPNQDRGNHKRLEAPCWRKTGRVEATIVDCDGRCQHGGCAWRCPTFGDRLTYLSLAPNGDAIFDSAEDSRHIACALVVDQTKDQYDCVAHPRAGQALVVQGLGLSTSMCTGGKWGNLSDDKCTYGECRYLDSGILTRRSHHQR